MTGALEDDSDAIARPVETLAISSAKRISTVTPIAPATARVIRRRGARREQVVAAGGRSRLRELPGGRAHVSRDVPDLVVRNVAPVGRHAVGPSLDDGVVDVAAAAAVDPVRVHQRRTDAAAAVE